MLCSVLNVPCSSKTYYVFIVLSILFSKVVSYVDEDYFSSLVDENLLEEKAERSDFVIGNDDRIASVTETVKKDTQSDEADYSENRTVDLINYKLEYSELKKKCPHYKHGKDVDIDTISDVWQVAYYQLSQDVNCFKIYIKTVSDEEKEKYRDQYGTFANRVDWSACDLELQGSDKSESPRRHFLQMGKKGIMKNVIVLEHTRPMELFKNKYEEQGKDNFTYTLRTESPDQWLVVKDLLLMRDCVDGDVVVFSRVPLQPRRKDIMDALVIFGEYTMEGRMTCK